MGEAHGAVTRGSAQIWPLILRNEGGINRYGFDTSSGYKSRRRPSKCIARSESGGPMEVSGMATHRRGSQGDTESNDDCSPWHNEATG